MGTGGPFAVERGGYVPHDPGPDGTNENRSDNDRCETRDGNGDACDACGETRDGNGETYGPESCKADGRSETYGPESCKADGSKADDARNGGDAGVTATRCFGSETGNGNPDDGCGEGACATS
jgi:hypothetical protein